MVIARRGWLQHCVGARLDRLWPLDWKLCIPCHIVVLSLNATAQNKYVWFWRDHEVKWSPRCPRSTVFPF